MKTIHDMIENIKNPKRNLIEISAIVFPSGKTVVLWNRRESNQILQLEKEDEAAVRVRASEHNNNIMS